MSFTKENMQKQKQEYLALKDELSRLEAQEKAMRKQIGLSESGGEKFDLSKLSPQEREFAEEAMACAKRAGEARAAQTNVSAGPKPGAGRRGALRV